MSYISPSFPQITTRHYCSQTVETMTDMSLTSTTGMEVTPYIVDSVASTATVE